MKIISNIRESFTLDRILLMILFLLVLLMAYMTYLRNFPFGGLDMTLKNGYLEILNEGRKVKQGDLLLYRAVFCNSSDAPFEVGKELVDTIVISYATVTTQFNIGCHDVVREVEIPEFTPIGYYRLKIYSKQQVNSLQLKEYIFYTETFEVIK